jgi:hypothetical protein
MVSYPCVGYCVRSRQGMDKQLLGYFSADPISRYLIFKKSCNVLIVKDKYHFQKEIRKKNS